MPIAPQNTLILNFMLDFSASMNTTVNDKTRKGLLLDAFNTMVNELKNDSLLQRCCSFGVTKFNDTCQQIRPIATLAELAEDNSSPKLGDASGSTFLGEAVLHALACIETKKKELRKHSNILTPVLILISDGEANGDASVYKKAVDLVKAKSGEINVLPIAIGNASRSSLADFGDVLNVSDIEMKELFKSIASASKASISTQSSFAFTHLVQAALSWSKI